MDKNDDHASVEGKSVATSDDVVVPAVTGKGTCTCTCTCDDNNTKELTDDVAFV